MLEYTILQVHHILLTTHHKKKSMQWIVLLLIGICCPFCCTAFYVHSKPYYDAKVDLYQRSLRMELTKISRKDFAKLCPRQVTPTQWASYWGTNQLERMQKVLESALLAYGGLWLSWFFSFMAGNFVSSVMGTLLLFNWMLSPWINSNNNNRSAWYLNGKPLNHAVFRGRIVRSILLFFC